MASLRYRRSRPRRHRRRCTRLRPCWGRRGPRQRRRLGMLARSWLLRESRVERHRHVRNRAHALELGHGDVDVVVCIDLDTYSVWVGHDLDAVLAGREDEEYEEAGHHTTATYVTAAACSAISAMRKRLPQ